MASVCRRATSRAACAFARKDCTPSRPSSLARMSAMRRAVFARSASSMGSAGHVLHQRACRRAAPAAVGHQRGDELVDLRSRASSAVARPRAPSRCACASRGAEALGGDEVAARRLLAHRAQHVGLMVAGSRPSLASLRAAHRRRHATSDVAGGDQAHAAGVDSRPARAHDRHRAHGRASTACRPAACASARFWSQRVAGHVRRIHVQVGAGAEGRAVAAEHDGAQSSDRAELRRRPRSASAITSSVEGVAHLGPVEPHLR